MAADPSSWPSRGPAPGPGAGSGVDLVALLERLPEGWSEVTYAGRRWGVTRVVRVGGRQQSVYAEDLAGTDVVSANLYLTTTGPTLRPCEMPADVVLEFLVGWV
ncbi:peptide methionine sulfoxide reductase [Nocardioides abyssi]|uniref:Peptide methionine sulfoxide reductase n=1 Tax=Nocardioides abyssi TaxID=3058370 RepID=A0ABT8ES31_9ACTN|nr:peptide methionine sulfoxide reductase [Nocardioides abyssi]MDN4160833.1 peptide methionine sulfoxide reductase [Nocardioides abyssi]